MAFSRSRLERFHRGLTAHVENGEIPGLVALLARGDETHVEASGTMAIGDARPMPRDAIFRIASITKPVTAAAAMILVEECRMRLDDPVDPWLPELSNRRVLRSLTSELDDTVPANRAITVRDLLTSTMGFGSVMAMPDTVPIRRMIRLYEIGGDGPPHPDRAPSLDEWLHRLGSLPWIAQPGERWLYHVSLDVLGALIARVSGQSLGTFMRERIFEPLGMKDTAFSVPAGKLDRLPACYDHTLASYDGIENSSWGTPPPFESGGGGLVSTIDDYHAFCRMLLRKGEPILSRRTVELMTSDHLTPEQRIGADVFFGTFSSWGFGMAVDTRKRDVFHTPGRFGWTGGLGTTAYTDPAEDFIAILFTQKLMGSPEPPRVFTDFFTLAYAAIE